MNWKEIQIVNNKKGRYFHTETYQQVARRSIRDISDNKIKSLEGFQRALARESISLRFNMRKRKSGNEIGGVSYAFDPSKANFKFSEKANLIKDSYGPFKTPDRINEAF